MVLRFLWASLQLELLCAVKLEADVRAILGQLPPKLEQLYCEIHEKLIKSQPGEVGKLIVYRILKWLLCARRQITSAELRSAVVLNTDVSLSDLSKERVLELCHNLVILDDGLDVFRFAHLSVREFLEKQPQYSLASCHLLAAEACLLQLIAASKSPAAHSFLTRKYGKDPHEELILTTGKASGAFHHYATLFWHRHCQMAGEEERVKNACFAKIFRSFLVEDSAVTSPLSTWLWSYKRYKVKRPVKEDLLKRTLSNSLSHRVRLYYIACGFGFCEILRECLIKGGLADSVREKGIELAAWYSQGGAFRLLWCSRDGLDITENTVVSVTEKLRRENLEWLLDHSYEPKITRTVISTAIEGENPIVEMIVRRFQDLKVTEAQIAKAATRNSLAAFTMLLARTDEHAISDQLLHDAIHARRVEVLWMLLDRFGRIRIPPNLIRGAIELYNDNFAQPTLDQSNEATMSKTSHYEMCRTTNLGGGKILELLSKQGIKISRDLKFAAIARFPTRTGQLVCELLGETVEQPTYDILDIAASNIQGEPGLLTRPLNHVEEKRVNEQVLMAAIHNYGFGNEFLKIVLDEKMKVEMTEIVIEAAIRLLDFDDSLQYLLDLIKMTEITERYLKAAATNERFGAVLVRWMIDNNSCNLDMIDKLTDWASTNVGNGFQILSLLKHISGERKIRLETLLTAALRGPPESLEILLDKVDPSEINETVLTAVARSERSMSNCEGLKLLLEKFQNISVSEELLESAARYSRDVDAFKIVWNRRCNDQISDDLVQAAAENRSSCTDVLLFLLEENVRQSHKIELGENAMKAILSHRSIAEERINLLFDVAVGQGTMVEVTQDVIRTALSVPYRTNGAGLISVLSKFCTDDNVAEDVFVGIAGSGNEENLDALSLHCEMSGTPSKWVEIARLRTAVRHGSDQVKGLLIQGADPNVPDFYGQTPLFLAVRYSYNEVARQLLAAGADPNHRDNQDSTTLFCVEASAIPESDKLTDTLLSLGADPNAMNKYGNTPLFFAAISGSYNFVQNLLNRGVSACVRNMKGNTPSSLANEKGHIKICRLLERYENEEKMRNDERQEK